MQHFPLPKLGIISRPFKISRLTYRFSSSLNIIFSSHLSSSSALSFNNASAKFMNILALRWRLLFQLNLPFPPFPLISKQIYIKISKGLLNYWWRQSLLISLLTTWRNVKQLTKMPLVAVSCQWLPGCFVDRTSWSVASSIVVTYRLLHFGNHHGSESFQLIKPVPIKGKYSFWRSP